MPRSPPTPRIPPVAGSCAASAYAAAGLLDLFLRPGPSGSYRRAIRLRLRSPPPGPPPGPPPLPPLLLRPLRLSEFVGSGPRSKAARRLVAPVKPDFLSDCIPRRRLLVRQQLGTERGDRPELASRGRSRAEAAREGKLGLARRERRERGPVPIARAETKGGPIRF